MSLVQPSEAVRVLPRSEYVNGRLITYRDVKDGWDAIIVFESHQDSPEKTSGGALIGTRMIRTFPFKTHKEVCKFARGIAKTHVID